MASRLIHTAPRLAKACEKVGRAAQLCKDIPGTIKVVRTGKVALIEDGMPLESRPLTRVSKACLISRLNSHLLTFTFLVDPHQISMKLSFSDKLHDYPPVLHELSSQLVHEGLDPSMLKLEPVTQMTSGEGRIWNVTLPAEGKEPAVNIRLSMENSPATKDVIEHKELSTTLTDGTILPGWEYLLADEIIQYEETGDGIHLGRLDWLLEKLIAGKKTIPPFLFKDALGYGVLERFFGKLPKDKEAHFADRLAKVGVGRKGPIN